jgi:hypothetical protein
MSLADFMFLLFVLSPLIAATFGWLIGFLGGKEA